MQSYYAIHMHPLHTPSVPTLRLPASGDVYSWIPSSAPSLLETFPTPTMPSETPTSVLAAVATSTVLLLVVVVAGVVVTMVVVMVVVVCKRRRKGESNLNVHVSEKGTV